tara:strand:+ start:4991 stop:5695 length:705 start_codon:yes stop_codon:yes gene_type:complete
MILITRHKKDTSLLQSALSKKKLKSIAFPLTKFTFLEKNISKSKSIFIIASPRSILFLKKNHSQILQNQRFLVIGKTTSKKLVDLGYKNILINANSSEELIKKLKNKKLNSERFQYLCSNIYNRDFIKHLRALDYKIRITRVYKTIPIKSLDQNLLTKINEERLSAVVFYSRFSLDTFLRLIKKHSIAMNKINGLKFYCLSERIAKPAIKQNFKVLYPSSPNEDKLTELIVNDI